MTNNTNEVRSTSVGITLNCKSLGIDAFIKLEQTAEFTDLISEVDALVKREEMAALLTEQALEIAKDTAQKVKTRIAEIAPTLAPAPTGYAPAGTGASAIRAVANGADTQSDWRVAVDAFDSAKQVRYVSTQALPSDSMKQLGYEWLKSQGFSAAAFDIWDERRDAENGKPISSVCNLKVKEEYRAQLPADLIYTDKGGVKALARAKFNSDGSLFFYWANKQIDTAIKYGALDAIKA
jgi:hypothetical protein